jgi:hypothetical protein
MKAEAKRRQNWMAIVHLVERNSSGDEYVDICTTEIVWPTKDKPSPCSSLQLVQKNR